LTNFFNGSYIAAKDETSEKVQPAPNEVYFMADDNDID